MALDVERLARSMATALENDFDIAAAIQELWGPALTASGYSLVRTDDLAGLRAAAEFIEDHDADAHSDSTWPCDGQCVHARRLRATLADTLRREYLSDSDYDVQIAPEEHDLG